MAGFQNKEKSRSRITGVKSSQSVQSQTKRFEPLDEMANAMEEYYSSHPATSAQQAEAQEKETNEVTAATAMDDRDVRPMGGTPIAGENWMKFFAFMFSRLRRWFRGFWAAAQFTHPAAWLLAGRERSRK